MTTFEDEFSSVLALIVESCDEIGSYMESLDFIKKDAPADAARFVHDKLTPFEYLKAWSWTRSWDEYFSKAMVLWDGGKMSAISFIAVIERLSAPAARLDVLVPKLERECQRLRNVPRSIPKHAREMNTCVNSFLNSADDAFIIWKKSKNFFDTSEIRRRRPIVRESPIVDRSIPDAGIEGTADEGKKGIPVPTSAQQQLNSIRRTLTNHSALLALTGLVCIIACIIQGQAFAISVQRSGSPRGSINDPEFYNTLQTFLMQTLTLYTVLAPALRPNGQRYEFWAWLLSALSLIVGVIALAVYPRFTTLSPLLACVSNVLQALVTLQLVLALNAHGPSIRQGDTRKKL